MAGAAFAACSSSDDEILNDQPIVNPTAPKTYTMTVQATKGDAAGKGRLRPLSRKGRLGEQNQRQAFLGLWRTTENFDITRTNWA